MILENKVGQKFKLSKDNFNEICAPKLRNIRYWKKSETFKWFLT